MPTRVSLERLDGLILASQGLLEMKRQVDRVELEVKTLKARLEARQASGSGGNTPVTETMSGGGQSATSAPPAPATATATMPTQVPVEVTMAASDSSPAVTPAATAAEADISMVEPPAATTSAAVTPGASESAFEEGVDKDGRPFKRPVSCGVCWDAVDLRLTDTSSSGRILSRARRWSLERQERNFACLLASLYNVCFRDCSLRRM